MIFTICIPEAYSYDTLEEYWAYWLIYLVKNRYTPAPKPLYE